MKRNSKHYCLITVAACAAITAILVALPAAAAPSPQKTATKTVAKNEKKSSQPRTGAIRTLDAINIEGEIAVPQVLFITSRDYPRYRDGLRFLFRKSKLEVARSLDLPARLRIVAQPKINKEEGP
jgi:hypothetical protein